MENKDMNNLYADGTEPVDLIASGYEWICGNCGTMNTEIEIYESVGCNDCGATFYTGDAEHAFH